MKVTSEQKIELHKNVCDFLNKVYEAKNHDYGDSFGKSVSKRGITAAMVRMEDKWNRLDNLTINPDEAQVKDEAIADTLLDLANYCIMTYMEMEIHGGENNIPKSPYYFLNPGTEVMGVNGIGS